MGFSTLHTIGCTIACYVAIGFCFYKSIELLVAGSEFANSTEEKCVVIDYDAEDCTYGRGGKGTKYTYEAIARSKCGNQTLFSHELDEEKCPGLFVDIGYEYI